MYKKIMVPTDGSEASPLAIKSCLRLAESTQVSKIVIVTVVEIPPQLRAYKGDLGSAYQEMEAMLRRDAEAILEEGAKYFAHCDTKLEKKLIWGDAPYAIVQEARIGKYDLIVIGSRGLGGVESMLIGSVSLHVVQQAPCAVMVTRMHGKQPSGPAK